MREQPLRKPFRSLLEIRVEQGLSIAQLAERTAIHKGTLSQIENGRRWPTSTELANIALALDVKLELRLQVIEDVGE